MEESKRKYLSEFAISLFSARWMMIPAHQLSSDGEFKKAELEVALASHIYLICKTPAISFSRDLFKYENGILSGSIKYSLEGEIREKLFSFEFPLLDGAETVQLSSFPFREIHTLDSQGNIVRKLPANLVSMGLGWHLQNKELSDFEVLYIGQAYGDGKRTAFERLKSHSTLQKILAQINYDSPEYEIQLLTFEYSPYRIIHQMDGRAKNAISDYRDLDRFRSVTVNHLTEHQQICLVEAGLIRYFQPQYNVIYKDNFPNGKHKILEACYDLDFSGLIIEINTEDLGFSLWSSGINARDHHIAKIDLVDPNIRWGFFHIFNDDGSALSMPNVIAKST